MPLNVVVAGVEKASTRADITINNAQKRVTRIEVYDGSAWKSGQRYVQPLTVSQSPTGTIFTTNPNPPSGTVISRAVTAVPSGGLAPFSYAWTIFSGGPGASIASPSVATTTFRATLAPGTSSEGVARCTVTDSLGTTATVDVDFVLFRTGGFG